MGTTRAKDSDDDEDDAAGRDRPDEGNGGVSGGGNRGTRRGIKTDGMRHHAEMMIHACTSSMGFAVQESVLWTKQQKRWDAMRAWSQWIHVYRYGVSASRGLA